MTYNGGVLIDMSAWGRMLLGVLSEPDEGRFSEAVRSGEVNVCEPFMLEALYSARSGADYGDIRARLTTLPLVSTPAGLLTSALAAQQTLATVAAVSHRVSVVDLMLAVVASHHGLGILHYDHDYDVIRAHSGLTFRSVWIAPRGSLS